MVKHRVLFLKISNKITCSFSPLLLHIVLEVLFSSIKQEWETKCIKIGEEEVKTIFVCRWHGCLYEKSKEYTEKILELMSLARLLGTRCRYKNQSLYNSYIRNWSKKSTPFIVEQKTLNRDKSISPTGWELQNIFRKIKEYLTKERFFVHWLEG